MLNIQFRKAWDLFCNYYQDSRKDYERYNSPSMKMKSDFHGPHFREERDVVFHLARFCYKEFGDQWVHLDSPVYNMYFEKLDTKKRFVDIDISNPVSFMTKNAKRQISIEVKWIWQGIHKARSSYIKNILEAIEKDLARLHYLWAMGCFENAFICIIDEEPKYTLIEKQGKAKKWAKKFSPVEVLVQTYSQ